MAVTPHATRLCAKTVDVVGGPVVIYESADVDADLNHAIATGAPTPYGRVLWATAPLVANAVASLDLAGKRVVELGCGTGLASIVAARCGARVLATDVDDAVLDAVKRAASDAGVHVATALFDVRAPSPLPDADVVVAADVMYEEALAASLARRVIEARQRGMQVVLGDPGRVFRAQLVAILEHAGIVAQFSADGVAVL